MVESLTISRIKSEDPAFNYEKLREKGIATLQNIGSSTWTDHNIHDPGITILEFLCFALTDLSYRASYPIPDLLASHPENGESSPSHFLSAKRIFPNKAVTVSDYRKLLIDIEKIKNAWVVPRNKTAFADLYHKKLSLTPPVSKRWESFEIRGFYDVWLEFDIHITADEKEETKAVAKDLLMNNRNLSEDFLGIDEIGQEQYRLCSEIELEAGADPIEVLSRVFFNIRLYLNPLIRFYLLDELFDKGMSTDSIFEGPLLEHGFIIDEELENADLRTEIYLSDIMQQILSVEGVQNILEIVFNPLAEGKSPVNPWIIPVTASKQPVVNILASQVVVYKGGMPFRPDLMLVKEKSDQLFEDFYNQNESLTTEDIPFDQGTDLSVEQYNSIQQHFPKNYGISHWGLPSDATLKRKMQAKQLQAYVYLFDQLMANYFSQIAHLKNLLSVDVETKTYFTQLVQDFKDAEDLFVSPENLLESIQLASENPDTFDRRRNLFLDHLLSRFSETFSDYLGILKTAFGESDKETERAGILNTKINFLKNYPAHSSERFSGYNYALPEDYWDTDNISGLQKRLQHLLGIQDMKRRSLVNIYVTIEHVTDEEAEGFEFFVRENGTNKVLLKSPVKFDSKVAAEDRLLHVLELMEDFGRYEIVEEEADQFIYLLKAGNGDIMATSDDIYDSRSTAEAGFLQARQSLEGDYCEEGIFLLENLLLFPEDEGNEPPLSPPTSPTDAEDGLLPLELDENGKASENLDPYSFRISIVAPAYATRFMNMDFRRYCERTIRMEMPAHLYPRICWVSNEQLLAFEKAYKSWLAVKAGELEDPDRVILSELIDVLTNLHSVYPKSRLQDCSSLEERQLFLLNKNALGTIKSS